MITLPVTCTQLGIILGAIAFSIGMTILVTQPWHPWNNWIVVGIAFVVPPAFIGSILGGEKIYGYLEKRIKCRCDK